MAHSRRASFGVGIFVPGLCLCAICVLIKPSPPFRITPGTPQSLVEALEDAYRSSYDGVVAYARPGGAYWAPRTPEVSRIVEFGDKAVPILIANLGNKRLQYTAIRALVDLKAEIAVPALVEHLEMSDSLHDAAIMDTLSEITGCDSYLRFWFFYDVRIQAVAEYSEWCRKHGLRVPSKVDTHAKDWAELQDLIQQRTDLGLIIGSGERPMQNDRLTAAVDEIVPVFRRWLRNRNIPKLVDAYPYRNGDTVTLHLTWLQADAAQ